ncbi:amidohydrolase family protein [Paraburkholderia xenovorans LB400]|uniref:Amidohydrolase n=1 Tax=Paraburkholderia xenovorans (strain LB400) TaxID=266265 RepID=Q13GV5_PARXL|nr:cytosine deaminase [Paraburkholderia xenovorans]ABE36684.1 Putative amidohydrolase [Paraburkholderia xenovorans LB400]AIP35149.1 amidohydrolase family protein [Paraburkholderia xenovorans LB400]
MSATFFAVPDVRRYALRNVRVPACTTAQPAHSGDFVEADLLIEDGRIAAVAPAGTVPAADGPDLGRSLVLPGMIDCHTHLDKGHIWPRQPNPTGDVPGAAHATGVDRTARWNAEDVRRRMEFGLMTAWAHGVVAIRTHLDCLAPQAAISLPVLEALRDAWAGRIALQANVLVPLDVYLTDEARALADAAQRAGATLGAVARFRTLPNHPITPQFDVAMTRLLRLASERGLDVDLHVDESTDPTSRMLPEVARIVRRERFDGRVLCGHCCSLALQDERYVDATLDALAAARIDIVSLPTVNLYLQSRAPGKTPTWRGVTLLHEMRARGLRVAVAGDNCRDPFYAYGDHDMLDTFTQAVRILQLDHPIGDWLAAATRTPAQIMGLEAGPRGVVAAGEPADVIVTRARDYSELLSRHQFDRVVLRAGRPIDTTLPDYRLLDDLMV